MFAQVLFADIKFARINAVLNGLNTLVAAVAGKRIRVLGYAFTTTGAQTPDFRDGAGTVLAGPFDLGALGKADYIGGPECPAFETGIGQSLVLNNSVLTSARGHLTYVEV